MPSRPDRLATARDLAFGVAVAGALVLGGVHPGTRAFVHLCLAVTCLVAAARGPRSAGQQRGVARLTLAGLALFAAQVLSWLVRAVRSDTPLRDTELAFADLGHVVLVAGFAVTSALVVAPGRIRKVSDRWMVLGTALAALGALHAAIGADSFLGLWRPHHVPPRFFAPFVNPNHFAAACVVFFPFALDTALGRGPSRRRLAAALAGAGLVALVVWVGAAGPLLVLGLVTAMVGATLWRPFGLLALLAAPPTFYVVLDWASAHGSDATSSALKRVTIWTTSLQMLADHPLLGVGPGRFAEASAPYRPDLAFVVWGHAHNDWLEWVVEGGLVGLAALVVALPLAIPWQAWSSHVWRRMAIGALGLLAFAWVDFPAQIPALALLVAFVLGAGHAAFDRRDPTRPGAIRVALVALALAQALAAATALRTSLVERAEAALAVEPADARALALADTLAPWRPVADQARLRVAAQGGDPTAIAEAARVLATRHPHDPDANRLAATALIRAEQAEAAVALADRATVQAPFDGRNWRIRAVAHTAAALPTAPQAWADAAAAKVPGAFKAGWAVLPEALFWVDAYDRLGPARRVELGVFLLKEGDPVAAELAFASAVRDDPTLVCKPYVTLLTQQGRAAELLPYLRRLREARPTDDAVAGQLAAALEAEGDWEEAEALWMEVHRRGGSGLGRAVVARAQRTTVEEGLALLARELSVGHRIADRDVLVVGRMLLARDRHTEAAELLTAHTFRKPDTQREADVLLSRALRP